MLYRKPKTRWCKYRDNPPSKEKCLVIFETLFDRSNVCPACMQSLKKKGMTIRKFDKNGRKL